MATQRKKKATRRVRSVEAASDHDDAHFRPGRKLKITGGTFFDAQGNTGPVVTISAQGGITVGNK